MVAANIAHTSSATYASDSAHWSLSRTYAGASEHGLNARKNGCAGDDGVTDDTAALHAIRDSAAALGVPVFLPKGTYLTTGLILNEKGQSWILALGATILLKASTPSNIITISADGVTVQGGKLDGNKANQTDEYTGVIINAANVTISGVEATNIHGSGMT